MTTPNGPILFNSSTGSDTAASGLGPASAVSGSGASTTGASAVVTGIVTTGVSAGDLLWVQSSSARQFSVVASVDSGTQVTCDDVFANTESSRTWAIGGKRATFDDSSSRAIFADSAAGIVVETESNQTLNSSLVVSMTGTVDNITTIKGSTGAEVITQAGAADVFTFQGGYISLEDLLFELTGTGNHHVAKFVNHNYNFSNIVAEHPTNNFHSFFDGGGYGNNSSFYNCVVGYTTGYGVTLNAMSNSVFTNCLFHSNSLYGFYGNRASTLINCVFANNILQGSLIASSNSRYMGCVWYGNGSGSGVRPAVGLYTGDSITNSIFVNNVQDAISGSSTTRYGQIANNAFYGNANEFTNPLSQAYGSTTLTADPFTDAANFDFSLNEVAGGGAVLRAKTNTYGSYAASHPFNWLTDGSGGGGGGATHYDPFTNPRF